MPRCSHGLPFESKCNRCFDEAMERERRLHAIPTLITMPTYPVELALRQDVQKEVDLPEPAIAK